MTDETDDADEEPLADLARRIREKREEQSNRKQGDGDGDVFDALDVTSERNTDTDATEFDTPDDATDGPDSDELFEEMDVSDVDTEVVWESVLTTESGDTPAESVVTNADFEPVGGGESTVGDDYIVPKKNYCESCHFFSRPPEVECSYEGAEIVEIVDFDEFRVRNCPVVAGRVSTDGTPISRVADSGTSEGE